MSQNPAGLPKEELWKILVETAHALPMYKNHKRYVEDVMLKEKPEISPQELAIQLNIPAGEALVMLEEIRGSKPAKSPAGVITSSSKKPDHSLLDFSG